MATFTITTPDADDARVAEVMGNYLNLGRPATPEEIVDLLARYLATAIQQSERQAAVAAAVAAAEASVQPVSIIAAGAMQLDVVALPKA